MLRSLWRHLPARRLQLPRFGVDAFHPGPQANDDVDGTRLPVPSQSVLRGAGSIELHGVTKALGLGRRSLPVLNGVDAIFPRGRVVGIMGLPTSGKTTLVNVLTGNLAPDSGRVVRGMNTSWSTSARDIFRRELTLRQNVQILSTIYGMWAPDMLEAVKEIGKIRRQDLDRSLVELAPDFASRATVSLCYAMDFDCYVADEVFCAGTKHFKEYMKGLFFERKETHSIIVVTKNIAPFRDICDDMCILDGGVIRTFGSRADAMNAFKELVRAKALDPESDTDKDES